MKKLAALLVLCIIFTSCLGSVFADALQTSYAKANAGIVVDGQKVNLGTQPVLVNDRLMVSADDFIQTLGVKVSKDVQNNAIQITGSNITIAVKIGEKNALVNNSSVNMDTPPVVINGVLMLPLRFMAESLNKGVSWDSKNQVVLISSDRRNSDSSRGDQRTIPFTVVLDPGHGGSETGALSMGIQEKDLNLDIAKKLYSLLKAQGVKVYLTRDDDSYVGLYDRSDYANSINADLFVSIHNNATDSSGVNGTMTLYYPGTAKTKNNLTGKQIASIVQDELTSTLGTKDLGIISRPHLAVLRTTNMPAILAEVGFMTNIYELRKLMSDDYRQKAAQALDDAIMKVIKTNK